MVILHPLTHASWELQKIICDKNWDMTSFNLEKILEYFKIQESLRYENLTKYYLSKGIFLYGFSTLKDKMQAQSKTNHWIS